MGTFCVPGSDLIWILTRRNTISDGKPVISEIKLPPCTWDITWAPFSDINIKPGSPNALPISSPNTTFTSFDHIMLCLTHWFFLYIEVVGMKNKKLTADQISSPASTSVIWQKTCVNSKAVDWKNKQTNKQPKLCEQDSIRRKITRGWQDCTQWAGDDDSESPSSGISDTSLFPFLPLLTKIFRLGFGGHQIHCLAPGSQDSDSATFHQLLWVLIFFFSSWNQRGLIW